MSIPEPPEGTKAAGRKLWESILAEYELEQHELRLLVEMVRVTDQLDELDAIVRRDGLMVPGANGVDRVHPGAVEARQARICLARLSAAMRLPAGDAEGDLQKGARRPQRRSTRGVYHLGGMIA